ncbi:polysaccharide deacetylase family protein [Streptomyces sp. NPDC005012]|uniref:polysaccharide deacetylase family protein n=1 Tax=Streptomyces sp. NPDC005012 TaxID=3154558 RepID=UPI0033A5F1BA
MLLALPFHLAWTYDTHRRAVTAQEDPPGTSEAPRTPHAGAGSSDRPTTPGAPVVLAYHDVGHSGRSRYTVTPQAFEDQIAALARAGYRSLSSSDFLAYLRTGRASAPRTVFITFDDGTHGLWVHADRILAKYRMRAAAFLITGQVGRHRPYYLSWAEIERMRASGRWDFENHTHDLHHRAAVDRTGRQEPALGSRLWLPDKKRAETRSEYRERVGEDLDVSLRAFAEHDLPRPRLFAFPFSDTPAHSGADGATAEEGAHSTEVLLTEMLRARFDARLTNRADRPLPAGARAAAAEQVQRLEVNRGTTAADLLDGLARFTAQDPATCRNPLREPARWERTDGTGHTGLGALTGQGPYPGRTGYASAAYLPMGSADWSGYTVTTTIGRLAAHGNNVGLVVRHHSREPVTITLSDSYVRVLTGTGAGRREVARRELVSAPRHRLRVTVEEKRTVVTVDGSVRIERPTSRAVTGGDATGGIAISTRNGDAASPYPRFTSMTVASPQGRPRTTASGAAR